MDVPQTVCTSIRNCEHHVTDNMRRDVAVVTGIHYAAVYARRRELDFSLCLYTNQSFQHGRNASGGARAPTI